MKNADLGKLMKQSPATPLSGTCSARPTTTLVFDPATGCFTEKAEADVNPETETAILEMTRDGFAACL